VPSGKVTPGSRKTTMWEKDGCEGIWKANWVGDITEEGSVMTGRPEMMTPTEDMFTCRKRVIRGYAKKKYLRWQ